MTVRGSSGATAVAMCIALCTTAASAEDRGGVYGRLDHDTTFALDVTGGLGVTSRDVRGAVAVNARMRALDMVGPAFGYENRPGISRHDVLWLGVDFRPLVFARIFQDLETGRRLTDLIIDSIGFEMGVVWSRPGDPWGRGSGLGFLMSAGFDVPLTWDRGNAWYMRVAARWTHAASWDALGPGVPAWGDDAFSFTVGFGARAMTRVGWIPRR